MEIPGLGAVTRENDLNWLYSGPIAVPVLGGKACRIVVEGYDEDPKKAEFHAAIANFLAAGPEVLQAAEPHLFAYYQDFRHDQPEEILSPSGVWKHIRLGEEPIVTRRNHGDQGVYVSLESNCDWEPEHGLQIVFKNGLVVNKVGPFDGHLTNSDACADDSLEDVIYRQ